MQMKLTKAYKILLWNQQTSRYFKMYWFSERIQLFCLNMISHNTMQDGTNRDHKVINPRWAGNLLLIGNNNAIRKRENRTQKVVCTQIDGL